MKYNNIEANIQIVEKDSESHKKLKNYISDNFSKKFRITKKKVEEFLKIKKEKDELDIKVVLAYHNKNSNRVLYFDQHLDNPKRYDLFENIKEGEEVEMHISDNDYGKIFERMGKLGLVDYTLEEKISEYEKITLEVINNKGLHLKPISQVVKVVNRYETPVYMRKDNHEGMYSTMIDGEKYVDARSAISLMFLAAKRGDKIKIAVKKGNNSKKVIKSIEDLFISGFYDN